MKMISRTNYLTLKQLESDGGRKSNYPSLKPHTTNISPLKVFPSNSGAEIVMEIVSRNRSPDWVCRDDEY